MKFSNCIGRRIAALALLAALGACGGGGGTPVEGGGPGGPGPGGPGSPNGPDSPEGPASFGFVGGTSAGGPLGTDPNAPIRMTFTGTIDETSAAAAMFSLKDLDTGRPVELRVQVEGASASLVPVDEETGLASLRLLTPYALTMSAGIADAQGRKAGGYTTSFTTADGRWLPPEAVGTGTHAAERPKIASNARGDMVLTWIQPGVDDEPSSAWANYFDAAAGKWRGPRRIDSQDRRVQMVQAGIDAAGNVIAAWRQSDGTSDRPWWTRYDARRGEWATAAFIAADPHVTVVTVHLAANAKGEAILGWNEHSNLVVRERFWAARLAPGDDAWSDPLEIGPATASALQPQVAIDSAGNALAVWLEPNINRRTLRSRAFTAAGQAWGPMQLLSGMQSQVTAVHLSMDAAGDGVVGWLEWNGEQHDVWAARRPRSGASWGPSVNVEADTRDVRAGPHVSLRGSHAVLGWSFVEEDGSDTLWVSHYDAARSVWQAPQPPGPAKAYLGRTPSIAIDARGNMLAVWNIVDGPLWWSRYLASPGRWTEPARLDTDLEALLLEPVLAMDGTGRAAAAWIQWNGQKPDHYVRRFR